MELKYSGIELNIKVKACNMLLGDQSPNINTKIPLKKADTL